VFRDVPGYAATVLVDPANGAPLGELFRESTSEEDIVVSREGGWAAKGSRLLELARFSPFTNADSEDLLDLAEVVAGIRYIGLEATESVADRLARFDAWRKRAASWGNAPAGSFKEFAHWFFMDRTVRPPIPGMGIKRTQ